MTSHKKRTVIPLVICAVIVALILFIQCKRDYRRCIYLLDGSGSHSLYDVTYDETYLQSHLPKWFKDFQLPQEVTLEPGAEFSSMQFFNIREQSVYFMEIMLSYYDADGERQRADILIWRDNALQDYYTRGTLFQFNQTVSVPVSWTTSDGSPVSYFESTVFDEYPGVPWHYASVSNGRFAAYIFTLDRDGIYPRDKEQFYTVMAENALRFMDSSSSKSQSAS